ncbi:hypothetical protein, partial [Salmonella sp. s51933]|uniref:hypothetical protein n=1 Tax=Salmonella sp. s51933 TaxID=3160127 RepID=UPI00375401FB
MKQIASHIPAVSRGCDRGIYELKGRVLRVNKDRKIKGVAKQLKEAKDRMEILKQDDPLQAQSLYRNTIKVLQSSIRNVQKQAGLDESQIHQERRECIQIDTNHKKHMAMKAFVNTLRRHSDKPARIL